MRNVPADIARKIMLTNQTRANNADPSLSMWISRPTVPLINDNFLEKQEILSATSITDSAVAVCHPKPDSDNTRVFIAYVADGRAHVVSSLSRTRMDSHVWSDYGLDEPATSVSIAFDGTMPKDSSGQIEFITDEMPWVFWVTSDGHAYAQIVGDLASRLELASANVTDISAVRSMWSKLLDFDYGLCVFFIMSGAIYIRQLINGVWYDAEPVPTAALPALTSGEMWEQVSASRTWDYRVVLQLVDTAGGIYEVFTQFMGIGSKNIDHLELKSMKATGTLTEISYLNEKLEEHIEIASMNAVAPYGGLYSTKIPAMIAAENTGVFVDHDGEAVIDWGKQAIFKFDTHLVAAQVAAQPSAFSIIDANNISYAPAAATLDTDGLSVILDFTDFNNAYGICTAKYTAGTVKSMAGVTLETVAFQFTPTGLVPSAIPVPQVVEVVNI